MEDKKLMAAIMGAITAYIQMEQPPPSVTPGGKLQPKVSQGDDSQTTRVNEKQRA